MTSSILSLINTLTTPLDDASVRDAQSSHQEALLAALQSNRTVVLDRLRSDGDFDVVRKLREEVKSSSSWFDVAADDAAWSFVQECLLLLVVLSRHISRELELFHAAVPKKRPATCESAPPLPPDVLAVNQQKTLRAALQFVVSLGLCPHLSPGVGVPLGRRSAFGAVVEKLASSSSSRRRRRLFATTTVLLELAELSSLATLIFTQHLGDVMAALCQLGYQPPNRESEDQPESKTQELSADERQSCKDALKKLLGKVYQPIVVKELLILQGRPRQGGGGGGGGGGGRAAPGSAPSWLRRLCGQLLSERLMQPNGVQAVVRAILEGGAGGESDWRKCDGVARILVACPQQSTSADGYYQHVCPQILDLLHFKDKLTAQQFQRVATRAALSMVQEKPDFAGQYLLAPLLEPLRRCAAADKESRSEVVVDEWELTRCVEDVYKIWVVGNSPSALLLKSLEEVLPVIFTLYCFTKQNVSHLRATCQDILLWYLNHAETPAAAILALRQLSGLQGRRNEASDFHFTPGSDGGAVFRSRESGNDEDDALYEKLSGEQWRLECLMQLLSELKDSDLPGDFFLELLQELTSWTTTEKGEEEEGGGGLDVAAMTLLEVEQQVLGRVSKRNKKLVLLQVLAVMVETLQHDALLRKTTQAVDFVVTLIQRACSGLDRVSDPDLENPVETQTLTTALSLVATLLTGPELTSDDFSHMSKLLSPLETLSLKHPELFIRDLASNLRVVVATRGSCRPEDLGAAVAAATGDRTDPGTKQKRKQKTQTEAKVDVDRPGKSDPVSGVPRPPDKPLSDWLLEACDPDEPTRAFALRALTHMVENKNPESVRDQDKVLDSFLENLEHEDSFVYLSAIQGLSSLVDRFPDRILERLLRDFQLGPSLSTSNKQRSLETRLKLGEVLMRASRAMGELAPHLGRPLIGVFLQGTRDPDQSVRASSLSNLGELCQKLDYALGPLAQELSSCLTALIKTEKEPEVRRAAVHVVVLLLRGLSSKTTQVLGDVLLDLYRALKWVVRSDPDEVAVLHAQLALEELDDVMKKFIFPEQKLEKKIVVLP